MPFLEEWGIEYEEKELNDGNVSGLTLKGFDLNNLILCTLRWPVLQIPVTQIDKESKGGIYHSRIK